MNGHIQFGFRLLFAFLALNPAVVSAEHRFLHISAPEEDTKYVTNIPNVAGIGYFYFFKQWKAEDLRIRVRIYRPTNDDFELFQEQDAEIGDPLGNDLASLQYSINLQPKKVPKPGKYLYRVDCLDVTGAREKVLASESVFISFVESEKPANDDIAVVRDIPYREGASKHWRLDLAMKKDLTGKPRPAIVVVHGGGWLEGDKSSFVFTDRSSPANIVDFAKLGFVAVTINYRMSREAPFPAAVEDCKCAVRWLRAHAQEYNLDSEHIGAWGNSAGGHLALMLAMAGKDAGLEGDGPHQDRSSLVQCAVSDSGPVDMIHEARDSAIAEVAKRFLGGPPEGERLAAYRKSSPNSYIKADTPPLLLLYGVSDDQIPIVTADHFVLDLGKAGAADVSYYRLAYVYHCPHSLVAIPEMQKVVDDFFVRTLLYPETAKDVRRRNQAAVPAGLQKWKIHFDGYGGTPGDRSWIRVSLAYDGMMKVEKRRVRKGDYRTVFDGKLDDEETSQFFRTTEKIIKEYRHDKSEGKMQDGWRLTLGISSKSSKKSVSFRDQPGFTDKDAPPGFDKLAEIINRHLKGETFPE